MIQLRPNYLLHLLLILCFLCSEVRGRTIVNYQRDNSSEYNLDKFYPLIKSYSKFQQYRISSKKLNNCINRRKSELVDTFSVWTRDYSKIIKDLSIPALVRSLENLYELSLVDDIEKKNLRSKDSGLTCTANPCGTCAKVTSLGGIIQSPNFPFSYGNNMSCTYTIQVPPDKRIQLTFTNFSVELGYDFVFVYDQTSVPLGVYLNGYITPKPIISKTNKITVSFNSDIDNSKMPEKKIARWEAKFNIYEDLVSTNENSYSHDQTTLSAVMEPLRDQHEILCTPITCGVCRNVTSNEGIIESPNFPNHYGNNQACLFHIRVPPRKLIRLTFTTLFIVEDCDLLLTYDENKIEMIDLIQGFVQGNALPKSYISRSNEMVILFFSEKNNEATLPSNQQGRWQAKFEIVDSPFSSTSDKNIGKLVSDSVYINDNREYILLNAPSSDDNSFLVVAADVAQMSDVLPSNNFGRSFFKWMSLPKITLASDDVFCTVSSCGVCKDVTSNTGIIQSPGYPNDYGNDLDCLFTIDVPDGYQIRLIFDTFVVEDCCDFLSIYDGKYAALQVDLSGYVNPRPSLTRINQMNVRFTSDSSNTNMIESGRWQARFNLVPTRTTTSTTNNKPSAEIQPINEPLTETTTTQTATSFSTVFPESTKVIPSTTELFTESTTTTTGSPAYTTLTFSQSSIESTTTITTPTTLAPIQVLYNISACEIKYNITSDRVTIESPNYPDDYGNNLNCIITVEVPRGKIIMLSFTKFVVERDYDFVSVSLPINDITSIPLRTNLSGYRLPSTIKTKSNKIKITFTTDSENNGLPKNELGRWRATLVF